LAFKKTRGWFFESISFISTDKAPELQETANKTRCVPMPTEVTCRASLNTQGFHAQPFVADAQRASGAKPRTGGLVAQVNALWGGKITAARNQD